MVHLFLNCDEYLASREIAALKAALGDPEMASLNITEVQGEKSNAAEILAQASMMPFLSERRMLIVTGYLAHLARRLKASKDESGAAWQEAAAFLGALPTLPETCDLVLIEPTLDADSQLRKGLSVGEGAAKRRVPGLTDLAKQEGIRAHSLKTPQEREMPDWVRTRAAELKIAIAPPAAQLLAQFVGADLRRVGNELEKLATYAGKRTITADDVRLLVADTSEQKFFHLTGAIENRDSKQAFRVLNELLNEGQPAIMLLAAITNRMRKLIQAKVALEKRLPATEVAKAAGVSESQVRYLVEAVARYSYAQLDDIMERLLAANVAMVTGGDQTTELELLVADLTLAAPAQPARTR